MKSLVLADIRRRAEQFVAAWKDEPGEEKQQAQTFIRDFLAIFGISEKTAALYEKRAKRSSTGYHGYIDALISGVALFEMKSAGKDLSRAEQQGLDYLESLSEHERPHTIISSDFKTFRVLDLLAPSGKDELTFELYELPQHIEDFIFLSGYTRKHTGAVQQEQASIAAARLMASLYEVLERKHFTGHPASVFLIRTLFCLYADDSGLWERDLFTRYLEERTREDGSDLGAQLSYLFQCLNQPESERDPDDELIMSFPYVNGSVFGDSIGIPSFDRAGRDILLEAADFNWSSISPAIFGSLFQSVKTKEARRELGEHYTTETNILRCLRPLFLDDLESRFRRDYNNPARLEALLRDMGEIHVFDPACGCGNFLIIAYRELRSLELRILERRFELDNRRGNALALVAESLVTIQLDHFHGIEIEDWPATIARTAMFLIQHQANQEAAKTLGLTSDMLPLRSSADIHVANALRMDWTQVVAPAKTVYIAGNPPFIGQFTKAAEQTDDMKYVWGKHYDGYLDYVTGWFKKAMDYFGVIPGRFAFVSTNSICQGQPVTALFGALFNSGWRIRFAHRTFAWMSEAPSAAAVHCVITGYDRETKGKNGQYPTPTRAFSYADVRGEPVEHETHRLNAYLADGPNIFITKRSHPLSVELPEARFGSKPADGGYLIVEADDYETFAADPVAAKYLRPYRMGRELIRGLDRWCLWLVDLDPADLGKSGLLKTRVESVRQWREQQPTTGDAYKLRLVPHLFRPNGSIPETKYLAIPSVFSETRQWMTCDLYDPSIIAGNQIYICADSDGFGFAIIESSMAIVWQKTVGGRLKSDYRFSNTIVWNNLPLPPVTKELRTQIIAAGQEVLAARALHPQRSLDAHYNPLAMDPALVKAHHQLDLSVDKAFGARKKLTTDAERLEILFARYQDLTEGLVAKKR
ncbi:MAG: DNA methyltransferase [Propionibacteriaceae bacterium]